MFSLKKKIFLYKMLETSFELYRNHHLNAMLFKHTRILTHCKRSLKVERKCQHNIYAHIANYLCNNNAKKKRKILIKISLLESLLNYEFYSSNNVFNF